MQLRSIQKTHSLAIVIFALFLSSGLWADTITAPGCPSEVKLVDGKIELTNGWNYNIPKRFFDKDGKLTLKSGTYKIGGNAPVISEINSITGSVSSYVGAIDEEISDKAEIYTWKKPYNFVKNKAVFMCWALGDETEAPRGNIYLYQEVPEGISECKLTYYLNNGKRDWNNQYLECF